MVREVKQTELNRKPTRCAFQRWSTQVLDSDLSRVIWLIFVTYDSTREKASLT